MIYSLIWSTKWIGLPAGISLLILVLNPVSTHNPTVVRVATDLENPRGIAIFPDGRLLVIEAGTGFVSADAQDNTGKLSIFEDINADGDFDDPEEIRRIFRFLPGYNTFTRFFTGHDEVGGPGDIVLLEDGRAFYTQDDSFEHIGIVALSPELRNVRELVTGIATMNAIVYEPESETLFVAESGLNRLSAVTLDGDLRT